MQFDQLIINGVSSSRFSAARPRGRSRRARSTRVGSRGSGTFLPDGPNSASGLGDQKVSLTRSAEVAAYWALLDRDDDEGRGAILIFDQRSLERRYKVEAVPDAREQ